MKIGIVLVSTALLAGILVSVFAPEATVHAAGNLINGGVSAGADSAKGADQPTTLFGVDGMFATITNMLLYIIGAISVIMIIVGGLRYVLSGGDSSNITAAKNTILYAIVGIVVALLAYAAVNFVINSFIGGSGGLSGGGGGSATGF